MTPEVYYTIFSWPADLARQSSSSSVTDAYGVRNIYEDEWCD
jgi:hypothetical protein